MTMLPGQAGFPMVIEYEFLDVTVSTGDVLGIAVFVKKLQLCQQGVAKMFPKLGIGFTSPN